MMKRSILLTFEERIAVIKIDRNERRNSLDNDAIEAFLAALSEVRRSSAVALVITAEGDRSFCAGSDLKALAAYSKDEVTHHTYLFQLLTETIDELPCATIAAVEGACLGGGLEIALACDYRLVSSESRFGFPEITIGVLPTGGGTVRAPRAIGLARAREMMIFGDPVTAIDALGIGLVSQIVAPGFAQNAAIERAKKLASSTNRDAVMLLKAMLVTGAGASPRVGSMLAYLGDVALSRSDHFLKTASKV
jgi:enoyl-CoA hydratase/carnithine racemase